MMCKQKIETVAGVTPAVALAGMAGRKQKR
jgi:hypothetical protein